jgi:hypothetical protein
VPNRWLTRGQAAKRATVSIEELVASQIEGQYVA